MAKAEMTGISFDVLVGMKNPSKPSDISWLLQDSFETRADAVRAGKQLHRDGRDLVRVIQVVATLEWQPLVPEIETP